MFEYNKQRVIFGTKALSVDLEELDSPENLLNSFAVERLIERLSGRDVFLAKQVHGIDGFVIDSPEIAKDIKLLSKQADFLISTVPGLVIAVATADCLPVVLLDKKARGVGIAHAGWRGSLAGIIQKMIVTFCATVQGDQSDVVLFFGPGARWCCYEVKEDILKRLCDKQKQRCIRSQESRFFFDGVFYADNELDGLGFNRKNIDLRFSECTICDYGYCSYRREGSESRRQLSAAMLM